jgi:hypothetical protein
MRRFASVVAALSTAGAVSAAIIAATPALAAPRHAATCSTNWGTNAKHRGSTSITVATRVQAVRAGKHGCFDRLVIDLSGGRRPPFSAQYVRHIVAQGSGRVLSMRGHAFILINVRGPGGAHYRANAVNLASVAGFTTFRQVRGAGSFERITAIGLGVRARLPFRVFELGSATSGWRIVIDVGH